MKYYFVFQNKSYRQASAGGYLWIPQKNVVGGKVPHWERLRGVRRGDVIIHCRHQSILAVSVAESDAYSAAEPEEARDSWKEDGWKKKGWKEDDRKENGRKENGRKEDGRKEDDRKEDGWKVDARYFILEQEVSVPDHIERLYALQPQTGGPFNKNKTGKQGYLYMVNEEFYHFVILQSMTRARMAREMSVSEWETEREARAFEAAILPDDILVRNLSDSQGPAEEDGSRVPALSAAELSDSREPVEEDTILPDHRTAFREAGLGELVKRYAGGTCQLCGEDAPFCDRLGNPYLEAHHVQALSRGGTDTMDNLTALCPNCHRRVHVQGGQQDRFALQMAAGRNDKRLRAYLERMEHEEE